MVRFISSNENLLSNLNRSIMKTRSKLVFPFYILHCITQLSKMKTIFGIVSALIVIALYSCDEFPLNDSLLTGKWNIINDSTLILNDVSNQINVHSNYIGNLTDYYDFTSDGNLYVKEGTNLDTIKYTFVSNNRLKLVGYYVNGINFLYGANMGTFVIESLTENNVTLGLSELTPQGKETRIINLKKYVYIN